MTTKSKLVVIIKKIAFVRRVIGCISGYRFDAITVFQLHQGKSYSIFRWVNFPDLLGETETPPKFFDFVFHNSL